MSFLAALALIFITLKLTGVVAWSWWLILLPLYIIPIAVIGLFGIGFVGTLLAVGWLAWLSR